MKNKAQTTFLSIVVLGIVLAVLMYMYYYSPTAEKTAALEASNNVLRTRVETLRKFYEEMPDNLKKIEEMTAGIKEKLSCFPADVLEEDAIYLAVTSMKLDNLNQLYEDEVISPGEQMEFTPMESSEEGNMVEYFSIGIGGKDKLAGVDASLVQTANIEGLNDAIVFQARDISYQHVTNYNNMKCLVQSINADPDKKTIVNLTYAAGENGTLDGTMNVRMYCVSGTDKEYVEKDFGEYDLGLINIFQVKETEE